VLLTLSALEHCDNPADSLRREIEAALDNQRNIMPLLLERFDFSTPKVATQPTGKLYNCSTDQKKERIDVYQNSMPD